MVEPLDTWFKREIFPHEEALTRYLRRHWRQDPDEIHDLRQETYIRLYQAALTSRPMTPRAFLFTTARNLIADRLRRARVVTIDTAGDLEVLNVVRDDLSPERHLAGRQELRVLAAAFDRLPAKSRETVWLRRVERLSQKEVAIRLGIAQKTVEWHLQRGMKRLADALFGNETSGGETIEEPMEKSEQGHGQQSTD